MITNMLQKMNIFKILTYMGVLVVFNVVSFGQIVSIINYSSNSNGQVQLEVNSTSSSYYILKVRRNDKKYYKWLIY